MAHLPADAVLEIARRVLPSRLAVDAMRATCHSWREVIPRTTGIWLAFYPRSAEAGLAAGLLQIGAGPVLSPTNLLPPSPAGVTCWGFHDCTVALSRANDGRIFKCCVVCGKDQSLAPLPQGCSPVALFNLPVQRINIVLTSPLSRFVWSYERTPEVWNFMPQEVGPGARSVVDSHRKLFIAAYPGGLFIDEDGSGRLYDQVAEYGYISSDESDFDRVNYLRIPLESEGEGAMDLWPERGHHLFTIGEEVFLCVLMRNEQVLVRAKLFAVLKNEDLDYILAPTSSIGNFSVYLGPNKPVVSPSADSNIGARRNTAYIIDDDGQTPYTRLLMTDFETQEVVPIQYPEKYQDLNSWAPGWVASLPDALHYDWHCFQ